MPTEAKRATVAALTRELARTSTAIVSDYRGLTVGEISAVRRSLREQGIGFRVVKNRLMKIAAHDAEIPELEPLLQGPSAVAFGRGDEATVVRAFLETTRRYKAVQVRGAVLGGRRINAADVSRLAALPARFVLLASLAGAMQAPVATTAALLAGNLRNLDSILTQVRDRKAGVAGA